jgi:REP element-mobilizing transposase RayT
MGSSSKNRRTNLKPTRRCLCCPIKMQRRTPTIAPRRRRKAVQHELPFRTWGGRRDGAGRKPNGDRAGVPHRPRPKHRRPEPLHVTMRVVRNVPSLRRQSFLSAVTKALRAVSGSFFQVVHFSLQTDHLHLIVEASDKARLSRGMAGLAIRVARAMNKLMRRKGSLWGDRYHARALRSPREVRNAFVYVLMNWRKHESGARGLDPCSSAFWFGGWKQGFRPRAPPGVEVPVLPAQYPLRPSPPNDRWGSRA